MIKILLCFFLAFLSCTALPVHVTPITDSAEDSAAWIYQNIDLTMTDWELYGYVQYNASPEEVIFNGGGDCRDVAALFLAMERKNRGDEGMVEIYWIYKYQGYHAVAIVNGYRFNYIPGGELRETQSYRKFMGEIGYRR